MRVGVFLLAARFPGQSDGEVLTATVEAAVAAERAGFDDVWFAEHHFMSYGICPSAVTLASYVLGHTERITVGTAVSVLSTAHPVALAEQTALLDQVSGGRFRLGVGRGGPWVDLEVFGTGLARYESGFAESLDLLLAGLTRPRLSAAGPTFAFREIPMVPRPRTRPPVVVACTSDATAALAAERGLPMLLGMHVDDEGRRRMVDAYTAAAGNAQAEHVAAVMAYVADTRAEAQELLRAELPRWLRPGLAGYVPVDDRPYTPRDADAYADLLCRIHPVGTAEDCVETMAATAERTGVRHLILMVEGAGSPRRTRENIARLGAEVLPHLRARFRDGDREPGSELLN
ncbi:LLM class flavin-dependent oxidoreductase [Actinoallomurus spadix]|uniref:LLM class flavin-dependent oxidoreductase n=1 Tax=Actinoallomurus spadix TaxID=79912 RepID=A0ABP3G335_9ACTN|nr:LLM class flavin-dependent oxidoreductase [Actinoallomurus spadix]MCO5987218.1 LLM class flavin-dependent oxidoreductase [Actinoallomurus spadix]